MRYLLALLAMLVAQTAALANAPAVQFTVDTTGASTRVVLQHSKRVDYTLQAFGDRIEIVYAIPVSLLPAERDFEDTLLRRYELKSGTRLTLFAGADFRSHEDFELRNPFRLVLDFTGDRSSALPMAPTPDRRDPSRTIIVIDPGHGGIENGAVGPTGLQEKAVTLDLALRLRQLLERDPSIDVVLTREKDRVLGLDERTAIANHNRADLFLSIHLNSSPRASARGAESYFLSTDATDDEARTLAALENRASGVDEENLVGDGQTKRSLDLVLWDLAQNQFIAESSALAESVQRHMNDLVGTRDRGVRQAPFRVLMGATMPAVLIEVGFISNPEEENRFKSLGYRNQSVKAMAAAIKDFLRNLERLSVPGGFGKPARDSSP